MGRGIHRGVERKMERAKLFQELIKDMMTPARIPVLMIGSVIEKKVLRGLAPTFIAASSKDGSKFRRLAEMAIMGKGMMRIVWPMIKGKTPLAIPSFARKM
jgi:hypothetical protein